MRILRRCVRGSLPPSPAIRPSRSIRLSTRLEWNGYCWNWQRPATPQVAPMDVQSLCCIPGRISSGPSIESKFRWHLEGGKSKIPRSGFRRMPITVRRQQSTSERTLALGASASLEVRFFFDSRAIGSITRRKDASERTWGTHTGRCPYLDGRDWTVSLSAAAAVFLLRRAFFCRGRSRTAKSTPDQSHCHSRRPAGTP